MPPDPHVQVAPDGQLAVQSVHTGAVPHAVAAVPGVHVPPLEAEQHPPLHGCAIEHEVVQAFAVVSQASPVAQSLVRVQPHARPLPEATQALPAPASAHDVHIVPRLPHAACAVPAAHDVPLQQPPLHGCVAEHVVLHVPPSTSHASPIGQADAEAHPESTVASIVASRLPSRVASGTVDSPGASRAASPCERASKWEASRDASWPPASAEPSAEPSLPEVPTWPLQLGSAAASANSHTTPLLMVETPPFTMSS
jgi:hypothetical protein